MSVVQRLGNPALDLQQTGTTELHLLWENTKGSTWASLLHAHRWKMSHTLLTDTFSPMASNSHWEFKKCLAKWDASLCRAPPSTLGWRQCVPSNNRADKSWIRVVSRMPQSPQTSMVTFLALLKFVHGFENTVSECLHCFIRYWPRLEFSWRKL